MGTILSFKNDVFISYAHIDNARFAGVEKGWIDHLHERLEIRLAQELGKPLRIWRDRKLGGNDVFNDTIVIELANTAILLSIISPRYLQSASCRNELDCFLRESARTGGAKIEDKHRVFKVVKTYVPHEDHPLSELLGYEFYQRDQASDRVREFDHEISSKGDKDQRYWDKFHDLVWDMKELIKRIESPQTEQPHLPAPSGATIYLAETTSDLIEERDKVKRELAQHGHLVLPDKPLPLAARTLQDAVREYLKRSRLSVHFVGEYYGAIPEMEQEHSVVRLQHELARERGDDTQFSRLIWMPPGLEPQEERQRKFIAELRNTFASNNGSELLQVKLEDLKTIIQTKLTEPPKSAAGKQVGPRARVYMICDQQDIDAVDPLSKYLNERQCEVILPLFAGTEIEILRDHHENLLLCDAVLIFQGQAGEGWLRMKIRELIKLPGYGRTTPLLGKVIYLGAPESQAKERFQTREAKLVRNYGNFAPGFIEDFVTEIINAKGGSL